MKLLTVAILALLILSCSSTFDPIEDQKKKAELIERCKKLKQEIDDLKGKPVRRSAAIEYFDEQCFVRPDPAKIL